MEISSEWIKKKKKILSFLREDIFLDDKSL